MAEEEQNKGRLATAVLAGSALAFSSFAFGAPAAFADTEDDPSTPASSTDEAQLEVDSSTLTPGDILVLSGTGFAPEGDIDVTVHPDDSAVNAEQTQADDDGNFEVEVEIPDDIENGEYSITADGPENTGVTTAFSVNDTEDGEEPGDESSEELGNEGSEESDDEGSEESGDEGSEEPGDEGSEESGDDEGQDGDESAVDEPTLQITPEEISLADFIHDGDDEDPENGVVHEVVGLDEGDEIKATIAGPEGVESFNRDAIADETGTASFVVFGFDTVDSASVYLGTYESEITVDGSDGEPLVGNFQVVEDAGGEDPEEPGEEDPEEPGEEDPEEPGDENPEEPGDEDPEEPGDEDQEVDLNLELGVNEAYPGDTVEVSGSGFTANGTVEFSINPALGDVDADDDGAFATEVTIPEDVDPGQYDFTAHDAEADQDVKVDFTVLDEADEAVEASLSIDPTKIKLDDFVGDPEDDAGVDHRVEGLEPGTQFTYLVSGPENVNEFEQTGTADDEGVAEFVIHGFEVSDPEIYLGDYTTVVTYEDADGETAELQGNFSVVTGDGSTGSTVETASDRDVVDSGEPIDLNGSDRLANTGADSTHLGLIAGVLLVLGGTFVVVANRKRLFARKS